MKSEWSKNGAGQETDCWLRCPSHASRRVFCHRVAVSWGKMRCVPAKPVPLSKAVCGRRGYVIYLAQVSSAGLGLSATSFAIRQCLCPLQRSSTPMKNAAIVARFATAARIFRTVSSIGNSSSSEKRRSHADSPAHKDIVNEIYENALRVISNDIRIINNALQCNLNINRTSQQSVEQDGVARPPVARHRPARVQRRYRRSR